MGKDPVSDIQSGRSENLTGTREMDATAIIDYFAPLTEYLRVQNATRNCGW